MASSEQAPTMLLLMVLLAATLAFVSFGLGGLNLAESVTVAEEAEVVAREAAAERAARDEQRARAESEIRSLRARLAAVNPAPVTSDEPSVNELAAEAAIARLEARVAELERTEASLKDDADEASTVDVSRIYGRGAPGGKAPLWVECVSGAVILQPEGVRISEEELDDGSTRFENAAREKGYVMFLVRPSGFDAFRLARSAAEDAEVDVGYEPVEASLALDYGSGS